MEFEHVLEGCTCEGKLCTKCKALLCVGNYTKDKRLKSGLKSECRLCASEKNKEWRKKNHEYNSSRKKVWYHKNIEQVRQTRRRYYRKTASHVNELAKQRRMRNYEQMRARERTYESQNRERRKQYRQQERVREKEHATFKQYYWQNKTKMNQRVRHHQQKYPEQHAIREIIRRTRKTQAGGSHTPLEWKSLKIKYDYTCLCCRRREPEIKLCADHIIPVSKHGSSNIDNIQPLCKSCNSIKGQKVIDFRPQNP